MSNLPLGIVTPPWYLLNDTPGSPMSPPRGPMGGGAFIVDLRGHVYVTPRPYLPIAKSRYEGLGLSVKHPLGYLLNDAPGSPMSPHRGSMGDGAFIIARRGTVYVTPGPYLPIAKSRYEGLSTNNSRCSRRNS